MRIHLHPRSVEEVQRMAMLNESNLLAMKAKAAKFRTHHVGTKLNEAEAPTVAVGAEVKKRKASRRLELFEDWQKRGRKA